MRCTAISAILAKKDPREIQVCKDHKDCEGRLGHKDLREIKDQLDCKDRKGYRGHKDPWGYRDHRELRERKAHVALLDPKGLSAEQARLTGKSITVDLPPSCIICWEM